jgi:hypothetical protein
MATNLLCSINSNIAAVTGGGPQRYDVEILCDPGSGDPVILRYAYLTDGTGIAITAYNLDGTGYGGVIADLVACGGGGSGGDVNLIEVGGSPVALGQALEAASIPVVLASDVVVDIVAQGTPTESNPSIADATSVTLVAANATRKYLLIQNNSAANVQVSLAGSVLTGIVPSTANPGLLLVPGASYESAPNFCTTSAITIYQTSGGAIETVSVYEA